MIVTRVINVIILKQLFIGNVQKSIPNFHSLSASDRMDMKILIVVICQRELHSVGARTSTWTPGEAIKS